MKVRQIARNVTLAWCPTDSIIVTGTMAGIMDSNFSTTGVLEFFGVDLVREGNFESWGSIETDEKLHKLAWNVPHTSTTTTTQDLPVGLVAGGMESGIINFWNPTVVIENTGGQALVSSVQKHTRAVTSLDFNPSQPTLLASGGQHGEVYIWDLNTLQPYTPANQKSPSGDADITGISWNKRVKHIVATSTRNGMAVVWDLKSKRVAVNITSRHVTSFSALTWSPDNNTQLFTASDDPTNAVIQIWDLRNIYEPISTLSAHENGVLSLALCHSDTNILLTSGKDNRTLCWDLSSATVVGELEASEGWKVDVQWSPTLPSIVSTCSLAGMIEFHALQDYKPVSDSSGGFVKPPKLGKPPNWLGRRASTSFAFGGKLVHVPVQQQLGGAGGEQNINVTKKSPLATTVKVHSVVTDVEFVKKAVHLQQTVEQKKFKEFCDSKATTTKDDQEKSMWEFIKILFEENSQKRDLLLTKLGFNRETLKAEVEKYILILQQQHQQPQNEEHLSGKQKPETTRNEQKEEEKTTSDSLFGDESDFQFPTSATSATSAVAGTEAGAGVGDGGAFTSLLPLITFDISDNNKNTLEAMITKCLLVANFEEAVECCFQTSRYADALVLAAFGTFGSNNLLAKAQRRYLQSQQSPFMNMVSLIVRKEFEELVKRCDLTCWREVLAVLCTYAESNQFGKLCDMLGDRLTKEKQDKSALLCHICTANIDKAFDIWLSEGVQNNHSLQTLIEKVTILYQAIDEKVYSPKLVSQCAQYANLLASQGCLEIALNYIRNVAGYSPDSPAAALYQRLQLSLSTAAAATTSSTTTKTTTDRQLKQQLPQQQQQQPPSKPTQTRVGAPGTVTLAPVVGGVVSAPSPGVSTFQPTHPITQTYTPFVFKPTTTGSTPTPPLPTPTPTSQAHPHSHGPTPTSAPASISNTPFVPAPAGPPSVQHPSSTTAPAHQPHITYPNRAPPLKYPPSSTAAPTRVSPPVLNPTPAPSHPPITTQLPPRDPAHARPTRTGTVLPPTPFTPTSPVRPGDQHFPPHHAPAPSTILPPPPTSASAPHSHHPSQHTPPPAPHRVATSSPLPQSHPPPSPQKTTHHPHATEAPQSTHYHPPSAKEIPPPPMATTTHPGGLNKSSSASSASVTSSQQQTKHQLDYISILESFQEIMKYVHNSEKASQLQKPITQIEQSLQEELYPRLKSQSFAPQTAAILWEIATKLKIKDWASVETLINRFVVQPDVEKIPLTIKRLTKTLQYVT